MTNKLRAFYHRQMFFPGAFGIFINHFYLARRALVNAMQEESESIKGNILDVGCGSKPYKSIFKVNDYRGLDIDSPLTRNLNAADDFYDGTNFPYQQNRFDAVLCNQVLEHVFNPDEFLAEINRVLKPGGKLLISVPFVWDEHEQPYDYARYSSFGLKALLEKSGFKLIRHKKLCADASILFQLINAYLYKITINWPRYLQLIFTFSIVAFFNVLGIVARSILPANQDLFLDHVVLAEKIK
jgi:SAM-dependent methyltransferase